MDNGLASLLVPNNVIMILALNSTFERIFGDGNVGGQTGAWTFVEF
jgi:hypothetical protein